MTHNLWTSDNCFLCTENTLKLFQLIKNCINLVFTCWIKLWFRRKNRRFTVSANFTGATFSSQHGISSYFSKSSFLFWVWTTVEQGSDDFDLFDQKLIRSWSFCDNFMIFVIIIFVIMIFGFGFWFDHDLMVIFEKKILVDHDLSDLEKFEWSWSDLDLRKSRDHPNLAVEYKSSNSKKLEIILNIAVLS